ncbi:pyroglutamyl-peptidase I [Fonticella tunisiensis]|uniref:Pyrrolidone-carboxylate peptidase n=1 Tax=Fonticella tunisiensis TaxID=1096341 RepID=A0A4V6Q2X5_9CLOT|nr:pyroglutamyl-peptidase I [Fonticella tunisiensis]TDT56487.1 pyroglutamyl-peptidase I [Fonticella tunisiensis]
MKILVTGFDPFGGESINPAFEVIKKLREKIGDAEVIKLQIPTVFHKSIKTITDKIDEVKPDVVLMIGQAGGRFDITVERVGINVDDARIADNEGNQPVDEPIDPEGLPAHFATIPVKAIVQEIRESGIPASVSNTAGTFVCNHVLYGILNYIYKNKLDIRAGFIHIPFLPEQVVTKPNTPSMALDTMVNAIEKAVEVIARTEDDIKRAEGTIC